MKIISHRGANLEFPENTLPAFRKALEYKPDAIETDVLLTKDGICVLRHDNILEHQDKAYYVHDLTYAEIKALSPEYDAIPTLSTVLDEFLEQYHLVLDIKTPDVMKPLYEIIKNTKHAANLHLTSFFMQVINDAATQRPDITRSWSTASVYADYDALLKQVNTRELSIYHGCLSNDLVKDLIGRGIFLRSYTINHFEEAKCLESWGVHAIYTDNVPLLKPQ